MITRYKTIDKFRSSIKVPSISAPFPGGNLLSPTFGDSSRTETRRAALQAWLAGMINKILLNEILLNKYNKINY